MISLFLDTSSHNLIAGIYKDTEELVLNIEENDNNLSKRVLPFIDKTIKQAEISVKDINKIFVVNGPGSFTGIRIGVAAAKTMAWALKIDICPISELEVMASGKTTKTMALIDARRGYVYAGMYEHLKNIMEDQYIELDILKKKYKDVTYVSYDNIEGAEMPKLNIKKIIKKHLKNKSVNPHSLNPCYLKKTEAEEKLNDRNNK